MVREWNKKNKNKGKKMNSGMPLIVVICVLLALCAGCFSQTETDNTTGKTITDNLGRTVYITDNPQRIVSLAPSVTEILFVLGLEHRIVGVDTNSNYPEAAKTIEKVGDWIPDEEKIVALNPDLILVSDMTSLNVVTSLEERGLTVVGLAPQTVDGVLQSITLVGSITGTQDAAQKVTDELEQRITAITNITSSNDLYKPTVYLEYYPYWTFGPGSFGNDLLVMAGGRNIASDAAAAYVNISSEYIVGRNPEIIIFTVGYTTDTTVEDITGRPGFDTIDAVKNNRIYTIDDDILSRPGPRIVDALEELAQIIHPELFLQPANTVIYWSMPCLC